MMMALAAAHDLPTVIVPGGVTLPATVGEDAGRGADARRALRARSNLARGSRGARVPRLRVAGRRLSVPRHRGDLAGGRRGARHGGGPQRARAVGTAGLAGHGAAIGACAERAARPQAHDARHPHRCGDSQRDGRARGRRRIDEPAAARARDRARRRAAAARHRRLARRQPPRAAPRRRAARTGRIPTVRVYPRRRRARGDAARARARPARRHARSPRRASRSARARLVGGVRAAPAHARPAGARATASIRTM